MTLKSSSSAAQTTSAAVSVELEEDAGLEIKAPSALSTIDEPATQPKHGSFPPTTLAAKPRCFSVRWYGLFPWLEYSTSRDAVFCKACRHFPEATSKDRFIKMALKTGNTFHSVV